jgi:hypothetical protein
MCVSRAQRSMSRKRVHARLRYAARSDALQTRDSGCFTLTKPGSRICSAALARRVRDTRAE